MSERSEEWPPDLERLLRKRLAEYVDLWEGASARLSTSSYRSEHLVDDWFRFWGKAVRDMTAGATLLWRGTTGFAPKPEPGRDDGKADQAGGP